jgi:Flp pilus assembly protein TadD
MTLVRVCALLVCLVAESSCGWFARHPLVYPEQGGRPWIEVRSEHFVLKTDLDEKQARGASAQLEEIFAALAELGFASADRPALEIDVVLFRSTEDAAQLLLKQAGAEFHPFGLHDFERRPLAILGGELDPFTREKLQHELTHFFVHYYYPQAPPWLDEGLAQFLETMVLENGTAVIGRRPHTEVFTRAERSDEPAVIPIRLADGPGALRKLSHADFYGQADADSKTREGKEAATLFHAHYASSWCLVSVLMTVPKYEAAFAEYLKWIRTGDTEEDAWNKTLGRFSEQNMDKELRAQLLAYSVAVSQTKWSAPPYQALGVRYLSSTAVHALWAQLRPDTPEGQDAAQKDLDETRDVGGFDPTDPDFVLVEAYWMGRRRRPEAAKARLHEALRRHPDDPRLWSALGWLSFRSDGRRGCFAPGGFASLKEVADRLAPIAQSVAELDLIATARALDRQFDSALAYEKQALKKDSSCVPCLTEVAQVFYDQGRFREALDTATLASRLATDEAPARSLVRLAESAQRRLHEDDPATPVASSSASTAVTRPPADWGASKGRIAPEAVQAIIRGNFADLMACYDDGLRRNCDLRGRVSTKFVIDIDGRVASVAANGSEMPDPAVVECVERRISHLRFPRPEGGPVTVEYPIVFTPED